jgi:hypothetical protein
MAKTTKQTNERAKANNSKRRSVFEPRIRTKPVGPYIEPGERIGVTMEPEVTRLANDVLAAVGNKRKKKLPTLEEVRAQEKQAKKIEANKVRIFDLMTTAAELQRGALFGSKTTYEFVPDYKDHTDLIAERPGAPGAHFTWYVPIYANNEADTGNHWLTVLSENWEFDLIDDAFKAVVAYRRFELDQQKRRDTILRKMSPEDRRLIGQGDWRDPEL